MALLREIPLEVFRFRERVGLPLRTNYRKLVTRLKRNFCIARRRLKAATLSRRSLNRETISIKSETFTRMRNCRLTLVIQSGRFG